MFEENVKLKNDNQKTKTEINNLEIQYEKFNHELIIKQNKIDELTNNLEKLKTDNHKQITNLIEKLKLSEDFVSDKILSFDKDRQDQSLKLTEIKDSLTQNYKNLFEFEKSKISTTIED